MNQNSQTQHYQSLYSFTYKSLFGLVNPWVLWLVELWLEYLGIFVIPCRKVQHKKIKAMIDIKEVLFGQHIMLVLWLVQFCLEEKERFYLQDHQMERSSTKPPTCISSVVFCTAMQKVYATVRLQRVRDLSFSSFTWVELPIIPSSSCTSL